MFEGQYSPVSLKQARLATSFLYSTCFEFAGENQKKYTAYDRFR